MIKLNCDIFSESNNIYFRCFPNKPIKEWAVITTIALTALAIGAATAIAIALATPYGVFGALAFGTLAAVGTGLFLATVSAVCSSPTKKLPNVSDLGSEKLPVQDKGIVSDSGNKKPAQSSPETSTSIQTSEHAEEIKTFIMFTIYSSKVLKTKVTIGINNDKKNSRMKGQLIELSGPLGMSQNLSDEERAKQTAKQALTKLGHGCLSKFNLLAPKKVAKPAVVISQQV